MNKKQFIEKHFLYGNIGEMECDVDELILRTKLKLIIPCIIIGIFIGFVIVELIK